jgi:hypothetical protein
MQNDPVFRNSIIGHGEFGFQFSQADQQVAYGDYVFDNG